MTANGLELNVKSQMPIVWNIWEMAFGVVAK